MKEEPLPKAEWGPGPWHEEPDFKQWKDKDTGYLCRIIRNPITGAWCGYVRIPRRHSAFGQKYQAMTEIDVHGGLTYSGVDTWMRYESFWHWFLLGGLFRRGWWFGFDCCHAWDLSPAIAALLRGLGSDRCRSHETYRTMDYAESETTDLARQLKEVSGCTRIS